MGNDIQIVRSQDEIQKRINSLTEEIRSVAGDDELTVVGILDDSFVFFADLIRALNMPVNCCFLKVTRHEHAEHTDMEADGVKSLRTCMLVDKPDERRIEIAADFKAFQHDDSYIFGYGLGLKNQYRHLPYLAAMK
jgi:hypoxanthine phosphoribosyltransferase